MDEVGKLLEAGEAVRAVIEATGVEMEMPEPCSTLDVSMTVDGSDRDSDTNDASGGEAVGEPAELLLTSREWHIKKLTWELDACRLQLAQQQRSMSPARLRGAPRAIRRTQGFLCD